MGNAMAAVMKRDRRRLWVKIMKIDGTVMKLSIPVDVKEILVDYPDHGIFEAEAVRRLGDRCRPLPQTAQLDGGRIFFLIPLPRAPPACLAKTSSAVTCRHRQLKILREALSLNDLSAEKFHGDEKIRVFPSGDEGSKVRVKLRVRKEELSSIVSGKGNFTIEDTLEKAIQMMKQQQQSRPVNSVWKPNLHSIAESKSLSPAA